MVNADHLPFVAKTEMACTLTILISDVRGTFSYRSHMKITLLATIFSVTHSPLKLGRALLCLLIFMIATIFLPDLATLIA